MERDSQVQKLTIKIARLEKANNGPSNQSKELRRQLQDHLEFLDRAGLANKPAKPKNQGEQDAALLARRKAIVERRERRQAEGQ